MSGGEKKLVYDVVLRSLDANKKVVEAPMSFWAAPRHSRFDEFVGASKSQVLVLGVTCAKASDGKAKLTLSDNGRMCRVSGTELEKDQGVCFFL